MSRTTDCPSDPAEPAPVLAAAPDDPAPRARRFLQRTAPVRALDTPRGATFGPPGQVRSFAATLPQDEDAPSPDAVLYLVKPGDSLWRLARMLLGEDAPNKTVQTYVAALHASNLDALGDAPDHLPIGYVLRLP